MPWSSEEEKKEYGSVSTLTGVRKLRANVECEIGKARFLFGSATQNSDAINCNKLGYYAATLQSEI
jgi:hypothetical protein